MEIENKAILLEQGLQVASLEAKFYRKFNADIPIYSEMYISTEEKGSISLQLTRERVWVGYGGILTRKQIQKMNHDIFLSFENGEVGIIRIIPLNDRMQLLDEQWDKKWEIRQEKWKNAKTKKEKLAVMKENLAIMEDELKTERVFGDLG